MNSVGYACKVVHNRTLPHLTTLKVASDLAPFKAQLIHQHDPSWAPTQGSAEPAAELSAASE